MAKSTDEPGTGVRDWKKEIAAAAKKVAEAERPDQSFISLKGGIMTYQDEPVKNNKLNCIIIAASFARTCFDRPYDPSDKEPPNCFSNGFDADTMVPHPNVIQPFADVCNEAACGMAEFGSALQGQGPRCKTRRKLIIMPEGGLANPAKAELATLACPPTSGKNYSGYVSRVAATGLPPWAVITEIKCQPHPKRQFETVFELIGKIDDDMQLAGIHPRIAEAEKMLMQPYTYETPGEKGEEGAENAKY